MLGSWVDWRQPERTPLRLGSPGPLASPALRQPPPPRPRVLRGRPCALALCPPRAGARGRRAEGTDVATVLVPGGMGMGPCLPVPRTLRRDQVFPHRFYLQTLPETASQIRHPLHHLEEPAHRPAAQGAFQRRRVSPGRPGSGRGSQAPPLAAPRARGGQRLSRGTVGLWGFPCRPAPLFRTAHEPRGWRPPPAAGPLRAPPTDLSQAGPRVKGRRSTGCWSRLPRAWGPWEEGPLGAAVQAFRSPALRLRPTSCPHAGTGPVLVHGGRRLWGLGPASQVGAQRTSWPRCSPPSRMRGGRSGSRGGLGSLPEGGDLDFWVLCVSAL